MSLPDSLNIVSLNFSSSVKNGTSTSIASYVLVAIVDSLPGPVEELHASNQ